MKQRIGGKNMSGENLGVIKGVSKPTPINEVICAHFPTLSWPKGTRWCGGNLSSLRVVTLHIA
ncbi:hypothetical protein WJU23_14850 [Prosthecobacter sp. SYSU 5D2]|uniref:hypothetical protein n=1 Tax=Prosthecobacter sp. SYSU 5D2 TaxID=3134134 RepID=UPI0031FEC92E